MFFWTHLGLKYPRLRDIFYHYPKLSYRKVLVPDSFIWYCGISKGILETFFNIAPLSLRHEDA